MLSKVLGPLHLEVAEIALLPLADLLGQIQGRSVKQASKEGLSRYLKPPALRIDLICFVCKSGCANRWLDAAQTLLEARAIMVSTLAIDDNRVLDVSQRLAEAQAQVQV